MIIGTCACHAKASFANPIRGQAAGESVVWPQCRYSHGAVGVPVSAITYKIAENQGGDIDAAIMELMAKKEAGEDRKIAFASESRTKLEKARKAGKTGAIRNYAAWVSAGGDAAKLSDDDAIDFAKLV